MNANSGSRDPGPCPVTSSESDATVRNAPTNRCTIAAPQPPAITRSFCGPLPTVQTVQGARLASNPGNADDLSHTAGTESVHIEALDALPCDGSDQIEVLVEVQNGEFREFCCGCDQKVRH